MDDLLQRPITEVDVVVLDTETTGLFPALGHRIVEIAAVRYRPGRKGPWQVAAEFSQLIQPDRSMDPGATRINGITDADLIGAPHFVQIADHLLEVLAGAVIVAHNARFDAGFLGMELSLLQANPFASETTLLPNPWLCTLLLARRLFYFGGNSLGHIAHVLGVRVGRAHRALSDVYVTAEVLKRMVNELSAMRLNAVGDLLEAQGGPIFALPPVSADLPAPIDAAIAQRKKLRIVYAGQSGTTERVIEPLYTTTQGDVVYLVAHCQLRRSRRTFRVDRIIRVEIEQTHRL